MAERAKAPTGNIACTITAHAPSNHKRDLDNVAKVVLDCLTLAGFWADDGLVRDLRIKWGTVGKPGKVEVRVWEI